MLTLVNGADDDMMPVCGSIWKKSSPFPGNSARSEYLMAALLPMSSSVADTLSTCVPVLTSFATVFS